MKIRLLGADGEEIGKSRQIRVTRDFIAPIEIVPVTSDEKTPKKYNLTADDKVRLEKLSALVKTIPETERKLFTKYIDQLGDIWYDRADRAETLLQFSQAIQNNKNISPDLKERLETAIELVYTQGEQDVEQKILARKIIADFLANSPFKKQIFGDGNKVGALDEIIDNPEYYEKNKSLITKIYDEYVFTDANISDEGKKAIKANLEILIGSAPDPSTKDPTTNPDNPPVDNNPTTSINYMEYVDKYGLIAGTVLAVIIALLVLLSLLRGRSRNTES